MQVDAELARVASFKKDFSNEIEQLPCKPVIEQATIEEEEEEGRQRVYSDKLIVENMSHNQNNQKETKEFKQYLDQVISRNQTNSNQSRDEEEDKKPIDKDNFKTAKNNFQTAKDDFQTAKNNFQTANNKNNNNSDDDKIGEEDVFSNDIK